MENQEINERPKKLLAIDYVNGITYVGKDDSKSNSIFYYLIRRTFGVGAEISDYHVFKIEQGFRQRDVMVDSNYTENFKDAYIKKEDKIPGPIRIPSRQIVAVHNLDDLDKE